VGLTTGELANLFNGVSQQPPALRSTSQHQALVNAISALADGLGKRPPTNHVAKLNALVDEDTFAHIIDRDADEKYVVLVRDGAIYVYDLLTGAAKTVTTPDGVGYLDCDVARDDFAAITIADHTFIVNKTKVVAMGAATTGGTAKGSKQRFSDLTGIGPAAGDVWLIEGDDTVDYDGYYVKWNGSVWEESTQVGITYQLNATTMPHKLVRNVDGTWTFQKNTWDDRVVGNADSNPDPSIVGKAISDLFLYRDRLGFCADESVVCSRVGDYYNLFAETVTAVIDSDPVDFSVSHTKVSLIRHALVYNKTLLLFSDKTQFQVSASDPFTPKNAKADPTTEFEASQLCRPVSAGQDVFFPVARGEYTAMREYFVEQDSVTNDAADITAHVPRYIPKEVFKLCASTSEDTMVAFTLQEGNSMYVYKYYWGDEKKKVQSAWQKYTLDAGDMILGGDFVGSKLYLVVQRADGMHVEWIQFQDTAADLTLPDGSSLTVLLDRKVSLTGVYNAGTGLTTWTLPYADAGTFSVILSDSFTGRRGEKLNTTKASTTTLTAVGDFSAHPCFVGRSYSFSWTLSEQFVRDPQSNAALLDGRLQLRYLTLLFANTGYFRVRVTPPGGQTYEYPYTGKVLGSSTFVLGRPAIQTGKFQVPIMSDSSKVTIEIVNDSYLPCRFQSAEWIGFHESRARSR
jgi:hypothetical protein